MAAGSLLQGMRTAPGATALAATALLVGEDAGGVALFSHDEGMNRCARSLGITAALR